MKIFIFMLSLVIIMSGAILYFVDDQYIYVKDYEQDFGRWR